MTSGKLIADFLLAQGASIVAVPRSALSWTRARFTKARWPHSELARLAILGDSLSASTQSDPTLYNDGLAALLATQARAALARQEPVDSSPRKTTRCRPISVVYNLAVDGSKVEDAIGDQSQIAGAEKLAPSTIIIWLGNNDVLTALVEGNPALLPSLTQFETAYNEVVRRAAATGARLVLANIPDVTRLPFLIPASEIPALTRWSSAELAGVFGIAPDDYLTRQSFDQIATMISQAGTETLPRCVRLSAADVEKIKNSVGACNKVIESSAREYGAALVDIHSLSHNIFRNGFRIGRRLLTTDFLGGMFSTDGIHPSTVGRAILANEFIRTINEHFGSCLPLINLHRAVMRDPLLSARHDYSQSVSQLVEGKDYYRDGAAIVFTAQYHLRRGYCCQTRCRHCPFNN